MKAKNCLFKRQVLLCLLLILTLSSSVSHAAECSDATDAYLTDFRNLYWGSPLLKTIDKDESSHLNLVYYVTKMAGDLMVHHYADSPKTWENQTAGEKAVRAEYLIKAAACFTFYAENCELIDQYYELEASKADSDKFISMSNLKKLIKQNKDDLKIQHFMIMSPGRKRHAARRKWLHPEENLKGCVQKAAWKYRTDTLEHPDEKTKCTVDCVDKLKKTSGHLLNSPEH